MLEFLWCWKTCVHPYHDSLPPGIVVCRDSVSVSSI
jgi:hypothetical protein